VSLTLDCLIASWNPAAERLFGYTATEAIDQPVSLIDPPDDQHGFHIPVTLLTSGATIPPYRTRCTHKDGHVLDVELNLWAVRDIGGRVDGIAVLFRDVAGQVARGDAKQFDAHRIFEDRLRALTRVSASLTFDQPMEVTLDTLATGVVEVTHAVACAVALIDEARELYRVAGTFGLPDGYAAAVEESYRSGAVLSSLEAYRTLGPVRRTMSRYIRQDPHQVRVSALVQDQGWDTIVSLPLIFRNQAVGAVTCCYPTGIDPDEEELAFLSVVADQAAVAVQTARLFAELQEKAAT
jgi:PAS domain S-box-containing protein